MKAPITRGASIPRYVQPSKNRREKGLTLIELLACISILLIITTLGTSILPGTIKKHIETTAFDTLYHLVVFTRTKAIREQEIMTLCASKDRLSCNGQWHDQIIVFSDTNRNAQLDNTETLFKSISMPGSTPCIQWNSGLKRRYLRFKPDGTNAGTAGHFRFCNPATAQTQKKLVISFTGRTAIRKP